MESVSKKIHIRADKAEKNDVSRAAEYKKRIPIMMVIEAITKSQFTSEMPYLKRYGLENTKAIPVMKDMTARDILEYSHHLFVCCAIPDAMSREAAGMAGNI